MKAAFLQEKSMPKLELDEVRSTLGYFELWGRQSAEYVDDGLLLYRSLQAAAHWLPAPHQIPAFLQAESVRHIHPGRLGKPLSAEAHAREPHSYEGPIAYS